MKAVSSLVGWGKANARFNNNLLKVPGHPANRIVFSGIGDEAGLPIEAQIRAHKELGWEHIDLRLVPDVDGTAKNITLVQPEVFANVKKAILDAKMSVACFETSIANWNRPINGNFEIDVQELKSAIERMKPFGTTFIRIMSWQRVPEMALDITKDNVLARMDTLVTIAEQAKVTLLLENCAGWAGESPENFNWLVRTVDSPNLASLYDTGNPVSYLQDPMKMYLGVKEWTRYVHIKDCTNLSGKKGLEAYTYPGVGQGRVKDTIKDLLLSGYQGALVIEPHLAAVIHKGTTADPQILYDSYVNYGLRLQNLVKIVQREIAEGGIIK
ncbi:MAG: sugar phosphate isomerase/epimerase [Candidatus Saganbacteria bacterium]|nr:sugar phosphate isomerase/epimerase [Candidatus Saganbacteria bacterium]